MKKQKSVVKSTYNKLTALKWSLYAGTYVLPVVPACVMVGINWEEWFATNQWSMSLGFASLLITVIITILGVAKKDELITENVSKLYYLAGLMALWAVSLMFLASIASQFGFMLLYTAMGLVGGATCDQVKKKYVDKEVEIYKEALVDAGMENKTKKLQEKKEKLKKLAQEEAKRRATE